MNYRLFKEKLNCLESQEECEVEECLVGEELHAVTELMVEEEHQE